MSEAEERALANEVAARRPDDAFVYQIVVVGGYEAMLAARLKMGVEIQLNAMVTAVD